MNIEFLKQQLKKGDTVYLIPNDSRLTAIESKVLSNGRKYITVEHCPGYNKFSKYDLRAVEWSAWNLFPGTKEMYEEYIKEQKEKENIISNLNSKFNELSVNDLKEILDYTNVKQRNHKWGII